MPTPEPGLLPDKRIKALAAALTAAGIPFAFGGALALVYWSEPRGTVDIDVNVFLPAGEADRLINVLKGLGAAVSPRAIAEARERDQVRIDWAGTFVDLFFAYDPFHESCKQRAAFVDFIGVLIPVLSAEDIVLFKTLFNRPKDWVDIEQLLAIQGRAFDAAYAHEWMARMLPPEDGARQRLERLMVAAAG